MLELSNKNIFILFLKNHLRISPIIKIKVILQFKQYNLVGLQCQTKKKVIKSKTFMY